MALNETNILKDIMLAASAAGARLFRNNVAKAWVGEYKRYDRAQTVTVNKGDVVIRRARRLHAGLCKGSSDLIGWMPMEVTEDMVGKKIAVMTAVEVKTASGKVTLDQKRFLDAVELAGGLALVGRSGESVRRYLDEMCGRK